MHNPLGVRRQPHNVQAALTHMNKIMSKEEAKINREMLMMQKNKAPRIGSCSDVKGKEQEGEIVENLTSFKAKYGYLPKLLFDLEVEVFARVSCFQYWKLNLLSKQFSQLLQSGEIFKVKQARGLVQPYVFMFSNGDTCWTMFDKDFKNFQQLPKIPSSDIFFGDKEPICAGTHLIVIGREMHRIVVWRYELELNKWVKDDEIITPRIYYASASRGTDAFFAGGMKIGEERTFDVVNVAERYDSDTKSWKAMNSMHHRRKYCSGCFLGGKFYVIGGLDENNVYLTSGESYDEKTDSWKLIPDMLQGMSLRAPPLIAVVNDNLYKIETKLNELWVYDMNKNTWKSLGVVPVTTNDASGWGVAFKGVGDKLLVVGASRTRSWMNTTMSVFTCIPSPTKEQMIWEEIEHCCDLNYYIRNSCVMLA